MKERGFYIIKDEFFKYINDPYLKGNKKENRPHYYCYKEDENDFYWMIPLSSRVDKYKRIINEKLAKHNRCDTLHIVKLDDGNESVFLIQDIFPVTENFIEREYTINKINLCLTSDNASREIEKKAKRVVMLIKRGIKILPTQVNVIRIIQKLSEYNIKSTKTIFLKDFLEIKEEKFANKANEKSKL